MSDLTEDQSGNQSRDYDLLDRLADEFAERFRKGERPSLKEYADRHPELADDIHALFPAMVNLEQAEEVRHEGASGAEKPQAEPAPVILSQIGDYRILRKIGQGGMGVVYEAEQVSLGRRVALKILPRNIALDGKMLERFRREARAAARLHHTNIVPVFEVGREGEVCYYAMQFIQGQGLDVVYDEIRKLRGKAKKRKKAPLEGVQESIDATKAISDESSVGAASFDRQDRTAVSLVVHSLLKGRFGVEPLESVVALPGGHDEWKTLGGSPFSSGSSMTSAKSNVSDPARTEAAGESLGAPTGSLVSPPSWTISSSGLTASGSSSAVLPGGTQISSIGSGRSEYPRSIARIGLQTAQALAYAHMRGVIHRDIKPSNLLLDTDGVVWITDFGLAKADDDGLTQTGDVLGTLRYMAPERFRGEGDARADVYALGLTLYELLTLEPAFGATDRLKLIEQVKSDEPIRPHLHDSRIPRDLETIVLKSIEKDQRQRYTTAEEMAEDLRRFLDDEPILARRATVVERYSRWARRNPGVAILGGVLTAVLVMATVISLLTVGRMALLVQKEHISAEREKSAKIDAQTAQRQAVLDRKAAEKAERQALAALEEADKERKKADEQRSLADANFQRALGTVDQYFTKVSESKLLTVPGLQPLRRDLLKSALSFYEDYSKSRRDDPKLKSALASVFLKAAKIQLELGQRVEAEEAYNDALPLFESLAEADPADVEASSGLAECNLGLGMIGAKDEKHKKMIERAIHIREGLIAADPAEPRLKEELARAYQALGELVIERAPKAIVGADGITRVLSGGANVRAALEAFLKAREIEASLVSHDPDNPAYQYELGQNLGQIAECLCKLGRHGDETIVRPLAIEHATSAYQLSPSMVAYGRLCAKLMSRDGNNLLSQKRTEEGIKTYKQALGILETLIRSNPAVPDLLSDFENQTSMLTNDADRQGRSAESLAALRKSIAMLESLSEQSSNVLNVRARLLQKSTQYKDAALTEEEDRDRKLRSRKQVDELTEQAKASDAASKVAVAKDDSGSKKRTADLDRQRSELASTQLAIGLIQMGLGDREQAFESFKQAVDLRKKLVETNPNDASSLASLAAARKAFGGVLEDQGRTDEAVSTVKETLSFFESLSREHPDASAVRREIASANIELGLLLWKIGRLAEAERSWRTGLELLNAGGAQDQKSDWSKNQLVLTYDALAELYARKGLWAAAYELYNKAAEYRNKSVIFSSIRLPGKLAYLSGDRDGFRRLSDEAMKTMGDSKNPDLQYQAVWLGAFAPDSGVDLEKLVSAGKQADDGSTSWIVFSHALALYRAGRYEAAIDLVEEQMFAPNDWQLITGVGWGVMALAHQRLGHKEEARFALDRLEDVHNRSAWRVLRQGGSIPRADSWADWGGVKDDSDWWDHAQREQLWFEATKEILGKPAAESPALTAARGLVLAKLERKEEAEAEFAAAISAHPDDPDALLARGWAFLELGLFDRAEADFSQAEILSGKDARPWIEVGRYLAQKGDRQRSDRFFKRAAELAPDQPSRFLEAGWWVAGLRAPRMIRRR